MPRPLVVVALVAALAAGGCGDDPPSAPERAAGSPTASPSPSPASPDEAARQQAQTDGQVATYLARVGDECARARRQGSQPPPRSPDGLRRYLQRAQPEAAAVMAVIAGIEPPAPVRGPVEALRQSNERLLGVYASAAQEGASGPGEEVLRLVRAAEDEVSQAARGAGLPACAPR